MPSLVLPQYLSCSWSSQQFYFLFASPGPDIALMSSQESPSSAVIHTDRRNTSLWLRCGAACTARAVRLRPPSASPTPGTTNVCIIHTITTLFTADSQFPLLPHLPTLGAGMKCSQAPAVAPWGTLSPYVAGPFHMNFKRARKFTP